MNRAVAVVAVLAGPLLLAARPGTEQQLVQQLNGQPTRWTMPDGGRSGMFAATNTACMPLTNATTIITGAAVRPIKPNTLLVVPLTAGNLCVRPSAFSTFWDGGCNAYFPGDENYGVPLAPWVPQYITPDVMVTDTTGSPAGLCFSGDAGSVVVPVWTVQ